MENKKRLIDANALREQMSSYYGCVNEHSSKEYYRGETFMNYNVAYLIEECIYNAPTVDAVEVVHGHWISEKYKLKCSVCEHRAFLGTSDPVTHREERNIRKYCFNCGAKMDGDTNE